jgi:tetratricopeptide (TPR) repeat protein
MIRVYIVLMLMAHQVFACLWDSDTLAEEAKGRPEVARIIVGWFDRYPPEYYQMRLERVTAELAASPANLDLLDDAAVACDRLGRPDDAIEWMKKKKAALDSLTGNEAKGHRYRYLANLGTFHAHRWVSQTAEKRTTDLSDLHRSEELITQAIKENPDAHFGREIYQLMAIRWLLWDGTSAFEFEDDTGLTFDDQHWVAERYSRPEEGHIEGISGLIQLGAAWQSPDAFRSLAHVLDSSRLSSLAELAYLREAELLTAGKQCIHPLAKVRDGIAPNRSRLLEDPQPIRDYFPIARTAADNRNQAWLAYQRARFTEGMHPDTHPDFWNAWVEPPFPKPPGHSIKHRLFNPRSIFSIALYFLVPCLLILILLRGAKRIGRIIRSQQ